MTKVVIDASAGAEILTGTKKGRALGKLIPEDAEGWVPDHFYAEVLSIVRRQLLITKLLDEPRAARAISGLSSWELHRAEMRPLVREAWAKRHNMTMPDALYVALAEHLDASLLTDDHRLAESPTFPANVKVLRLPRSN